MTKTTDYVGNKVYESNTLKRILVDGGYIEAGVYYYYLASHLGNNHVVAKQDGTSVQSISYYPFGMHFAPGVNTAAQPYLYNNKELDQMHGLNLYDYHARQYESAIGRFTTVDPLAEKYYSISPYAYVANNPLKYIDPDGRKLINTISPNSFDALTYIAKIAASSLGNEVLSSLINSKGSYYLSETMLPRTANYSPRGGVITYPQFTLEAFGSKIEGGSNRKEYWIGHEGFHAYDHNQGNFNRENMGSRKDILESRAVSFENYLREVYNDTPYRNSYGSIKGDFFQFADSGEKISNFQYLGNNAPTTKSNDGVYRIGASFTQTIGKESTNRYIIVSQDRKGSISYKFYDSEDEYKKATKDW